MLTLRTHAVWRYGLTLRTHAMCLSVSFHDLLSYCRVILMTQYIQSTIWYSWKPIEFVLGASYYFRVVFSIVLLHTYRSQASFAGKKIQLQQPDTTFGCVVHHHGQQHSVRNGSMLLFSETAYGTFVLIVLGRLTMQCSLIRGARLLHGRSFDTVVYMNSRIPMAMRDVIVHRRSGLSCRPLGDSALRK